MSSAQCNTCASGADAVREAVQYLDSPEQGHCSGIVDDPLPKDKAVQQGAALLLQHLKHCHRVRCCKDDSKRQTVLQEISSLALPSCNRMTRVTKMVEAPAGQLIS